LILLSSKKKAAVLRELKTYAVSYKKKKAEFRLRNGIVKSQFNLKADQQREVEFGTIIPADRSLQKYVDILNSDPELNDLKDQISDIILKGCTAIFKEMIANGTYLPGYDLEEFVRNPHENTQEIVNLMQGFGGYKHIHSIGEKIALEIPAKRYLRKDRNLMRCIRFWLKTVKEFSLF